MTKHTINQLVREFEKVCERPALRIARNFNLYKCCSSIVAYLSDVEAGRASMYHRRGKLVWEIGPTGFEGADDFDLTLEFVPEEITQEAMLDRVETALRFSISAAMAFGKEAA
jgi:hypothetical protein